MPITININGCPNSCARIQVADIGLKGLLVADGDGNQVEGFQVHLGGASGSTPGSGASCAGQGDRDELGDYVERVTGRYLERRTEGERFAQWVVRADEEDLR